MLGRQRELIARELAEGTGAGISVSLVAGELREGIRIWFSDLGDKHGPVAELTPYGLKSHAVRLVFGAFSGSVITKIRGANSEDLQLARALLRSISEHMELEVSGQNLESWQVFDGSFEARARFRHEIYRPDTEEAIVATCREAIVPMMAAMAELIGYDAMEDLCAFDTPEFEGALSRAVVRRRERNMRNRLLCLKLHGYVCKVCAKDPKETYGPAGGIIEVHHLEPLSVLSAPKPYDPEIDLVPLCPCCHRAIHTRRPLPFSLEELAEMMGLSNG